MPSLANNSRTSRPQYYVLILLLICVGLLGLTYLNRQNISDWLSLRGYKEPSIVAELAQQDTMTTYAQKVYKVNHPAIEDKTQFNKNCPNNGGEQTIVLGCYHPDQDGIYVLHVTDPRLDGVEQVTAAHEMLHAAYGRLSTSERSKVDAMLLNYYNHDLHDPRIISVIAAYKRTEPNAVVNEMHSVFGTEVANLPVELEQYYSRYFTDREKVTAYAAQYQAEFTSRQNQVSADDSQLATLKSQISSIQDDLNSKLSTIQAQQSQLTSYKSSGNIAAYNNAVPGFNSLVISYNDEVGQVKSLIDSYNNLVDQRNSVALIENQLYQELSGSQSTISN